jgi:hypothetical protein
VLRITKYFPEILENVGPLRYNSGMNEWNKYTYVCGTCDALTEITTKKNLEEYRGWCSCGSANLLWISQESATIQPTTNEGNKMEDNDQQVKALTEQRDNLASQVERLQNANTTYSKDASLQYGKINRVKEYLTENYDELQEHADEIAQILDIELTRDVTYSVQMTATITVSVPVNEDGEEILRDNLYIDANHGDIVIDDYEVENISEAY